MSKPTDVELTVGLVPGDVKDTAKELGKSIQDIFDKSAGKELDESMQKLQQNMSKTSVKAQNLVDKMQELENTKVPTDEYVELQRQIEKTETQITRMQEKWDRAQETGSPIQGKQLEQFRYDAAQLENTLEYAKEEMDALVESGKAFKLGSDSEQYTKLAQQLGEVNNQSRLLINHWDNINAETEETSDNIEEVEDSTTRSTRSVNIMAAAFTGLKKTVSLISTLISKTFSILKSGMNLVTKLAGKVGSLIGTMASKMKDMVHSSKQTSLSFSQMLTRVLGLVIGVRGLWSILNSLRSAIVENMQYAISGVSSLQSAFDSLKSQLTTIKVQLASAFLPLLEIALPAIQSVVSAMAEAVSMVSQLIASLTGASTWRKAQVSVGGGGGGKQKSVAERQEEANQKAAERQAKIEEAYQKRVAKAYEKAEEQKRKVEERNAKALEKYEKALKKAQEAEEGYLSPIDEINKYNVDKPTEIEVPELEEFDYDEYLQGLLDDIGEMEKVVADTIEDTAAGAAGVSVKYTDEAIDSAIKEWVEKIKDMWNRADFTELGTLIGSKLLDYLNKIPWNKIFTNMSKLGKSLATLINGLVEVPELGYKVGETIANVINSLFYLLEDGVKNLHWKSIGKFIADTFNGMFKNIKWDKIYNTFITGMRGLADALWTFITNFDWNNLSTAVINIVKTLTDGIHEFFNRELFDERGIKLNESWAHRLGTELGRQIRKSIEGIDWHDVGTAIGDIIQAAVDWVSGMIETMPSVETLIEKATDLMHGLFERVDSEEMGANLGKILQAIWDFLTGFWDENGEEIKNEVGLFFQGFFDNVDIDKISDDVLEILDGIYDWLMNYWDEHGDEIKEKVADFLSHIWDKVSDSELGEALSGLLDKAILLGVGMIGWEVIKTVVGAKLGSLFAGAAAKKAVATALGETVTAAGTSAEVATAVGEIGTAAEVTTAAGATGASIAGSIVLGLIAAFDGALVGLGLIELLDLKEGWADFATLLGEAIYGPANDAQKQQIEDMLYIYDGIGGSLELLKNGGKDVLRLFGVDIPQSTYEVRDEFGELQRVVDENGKVIIDFGEETEKALDGVKQSFNGMPSDVEQIMKSMNDTTKQSAITFVDSAEDMEKATADSAKSIQSSMNDSTEAVITFVDEAGNVTREVNQYGENIIRVSDESSAVITANEAKNQQAYNDTKDTIKLTAVDITDEQRKIQDEHIATATKVEEQTTIIQTSYTDMDTAGSELQTSVTGQWQEMSQTIDTSSDEMAKSTKESTEAMGTSWTSVVEKIKGCINSILGFVEKMVNGIIDAFNGLGESIGQMDIDIPDWVPKIGGNKFELSLPKLSHVSIPKLAQGAVIPPNKSFLAMLGDQTSGTNIETPLETMVDAFNQALQMNGGSQSVTLNLILPDKRTIAQYAIEGGQVLQMSRGRNPFLLERG